MAHLNNVRIEIENVITVILLKALSFVVIMLSYFECGLCTGAAVLTAKHQKGLHSQNCVLLQLYYIWGGEI